MTARPDIEPVFLGTVLKKNGGIGMFFILAGGLLILLIAVVIAVVASVTAAVAAETDESED